MNGVWNHSEISHSRDCNNGGNGRWISEFFRGEEKVEGRPPLPACGRSWKTQGSQIPMAAQKPPWMAAAISRTSRQSPTA